MPRTIKAAGEMQIQEQARQTCDLNIECECRKILFANAPRPVFKAWRDTGESASFRVLIGTQHVGTQHASRCA
jgi:hypothetical protein